jgi:hypothetical protein
MPSHGGISRLLGPLEDADPDPDIPILKEAKAEYANSYKPLPRRFVNCT